MSMNGLKTVCMTLVFILAVTLLPKQGEAEDFRALADAAILVDADSGKILYEYKANTPLGIAQITKMMTAYLVLEAIEKGQLQWEQEVLISDYTYAIAQHEEIRTVNLKKDVVYTVKALYEALVIYNANDAAIALAEMVAGSEANFVELMNAKAKELHLSGYKFVNASGLNNAFLLNMHPTGTGAMDENVMSARSVARLAYALYLKYPQILSVTAQPELMFNEGSPESFPVNSWNRMLPSLEHGYNTVHGSFGGYSTFAGHSMVSVAERDGQKLIAVVMKAVDEAGAESEQILYKEMAKLLDYGFAEFDPVEILPAAYRVKGQETIPVWKGQHSEVAVETTKSVTVMLRADEVKLYEPRLLLDTKELVAPVEKGRIVGKLLLEQSEGKDYGFITGEALLVEVATADNVNSAEKMQLFFQGITTFWRVLWQEANQLVGNK